MIKKTLNQNAKYAQELLKAAEPDFVFNDKPINRLKVVDNNISSNNENKIKLLSVLKDQINSIQNCNLKKNSKNVIMGDGDLNSPLMLIGESPGKIEDESDSTFQGEIGSLLSKMLQGTKYENLQVDSCYIILLQVNSSFQKFKVPDNIKNKVMNMNMNVYLET